MEKDLILEIGTEEIPAGFLEGAVDSLAKISERELKDGLFIAIGGVHSARGVKHGPIRVIFLVLTQIFVGQMFVNPNQPGGMVCVRFWP